MRSKRLISLLVAVCMMITMLPLSAVTAFAADTSSSTSSIASAGDYKYAYEVDEYGKATITQFIEPVDISSYNVDIPAELGGHIVTGIGNRAFNYSDHMGSVTIPQSVTSIDTQAFWQCHGLQSLTINDAATSIGHEAFCGCTSLKTLSLGENITTIGDRAFVACSSLTNVTIPEKVTTIDSGTFNACSSLEYIILPAGLTSFQASLYKCPDDCVIYFNNDEHTADERFGSHTQLAGRKLLCLCHVTFDANGGELNDYDGNLTDHAVVPVYKTEKSLVPRQTN